MVDRTRTRLDPDHARTVGTRVFLSYSRKDAPFANRLAGELSERGYAPDFDQSVFDTANTPNIEFGISAQDEWWQRLQQMIAVADVIVFIVSPDSTASKVCDEEIAYAKNLSKRIVLVMYRLVDFAKVSPGLAALNVKISFNQEDSISFSSALDRLCAELDLDVGWHRESKRLVQLAVRWDSGGRSAEQLMTAADIRAGERLLENRPRSADQPAQLLVDLLHASRATQEERHRKQQEQIARTRRLQNSATLASNNLIGQAEEFQEGEGVPLALTVGLLKNAVRLVDGPTEAGTSDPEAERALGLALAQLSEKDRSLNDFDQAACAAQRAVEIFERLTKRDPENAQYLDDLHAALDRLVDAADSDIALGAGERALELAKTLVALNPTLERRIHYAVSLSKYAYLIASSNESRAISMYTEALRIQNGILQDDQSLENVRRDAALTQLNIGQLYSHSNQSRTARTWVLASLTEIGRLRTNHPRTTTYAQDEAAIRETLGDIFKSELNIDAALTEYHESLAIIDRLSNIDNSNTDLRLTLMRACDRVADAVSQLGRSGDAINFYTKGLRIAVELGRSSPDRILERAHYLNR